MSDPPPSEPGKPSSKFPTTSWTLIRKVQQGAETDARAAMEEICRQYWYPIYAFARRYGFSPPDSEDLTQDFFSALIARETIQAARREKGRLRSFILNLLRQLIKNRLRDRAAAKRGGGLATLSLDEAAAERRYAREPSDISDPARLFERAWAERLLEAATERLRREFAEGDNLDEFEHLCEFLPLGENATPYAEVSRKTGIPEKALRLQIHRMRKRYAKHLETEIAQTVVDPKEAKAELAHLLAIMGR
ncbi:MAG: sigma-70 family RNA polymerase sigma factor [Verrucomicrobiae bacterium]|nr:sigma-70 family RNA polymerase sigma factor [Verrucomicrobiae bacterium]